MIHGLDLRDGLVRFVDEQQVVLRHVVEQRRRRFAGQAAGKMPRVIFDAVAIADGANHLDVKHGALPDALRFDEFSLPLELRLPPGQLLEDGADGALLLLGGQNVMRFRIDRQARQRFAAHLAGERVDGAQRVDLVAPHLDAEGALFVRRLNFDHVAAHAEGAAAQILAALVLNVHQAAKQRLARDALAGLEHHQHAVIGLGRSQAVDAGDRSDHDDVAALEERARGAHAQSVQLIVDRRFLLDIGVRGRQVGFGLVIVVVADEILDRVLREEVAELVEELRGESLVVRQDQGGPVDALDELGHREGFARAGYAEQHLMLVAALDAAHQLRDGLGLIAAGLVVAG